MCVITDEMKQIRQEIDKLIQRLAPLENALIILTSESITTQYPGTRCEYDGWSESLRVYHDHPDEQKRIILELWNSKIEDYLMVSEGQHV